MIKKISIATVYRTVKLFEEAGIVTNHDFKGGKARYEELNERLGQSKFLAGENYTIADIATWPWIARHEWHDIGLINYNHLSRWYIEISKRSAVVNGFKFMDKNLEIPLP